MLRDCNQLVELFEPDVEAVSQEIEVSQRVLDGRVVLGQVLDRASNLRQRDRVNSAQRTQDMKLDEVDERER
jgi:hypothetical protein